VLAPSSLTHERYRRFDPEARTPQVSCLNTPKILVTCVQNHANRDWRSSIGGASYSANKLSDFYSHPHNQSHQGKPMLTVINIDPYRSKLVIASRVVVSQCRALPHGARGYRGGLRRAGVLPRGHVGGRAFHTIPNCFYVVLVRGANGDGAWRGMVTIVK